MNDFFISYHPGAMGNFVKMLISSGLEGYELSKNHLLYKNQTILKLDDSGEVIPIRNTSTFDVFLDNIFVKNFLTIWGDDPEEIFDTVCRLYIKQPKTNCLPFQGGHMHTSMHCNNDLKYVFKFMDKVGINRTLFITFVTKEEYDICKLYRYKKRPEAEDTFTLHQHIEINQSLLVYKREDDIILNLKNIFDKEYLRNFFFINIDNWSDIYFDKIYDAYMNLQEYTLKV